jgi:hypothetical protein
MHFQAGDLEVRLRRSVVNHLRDMSETVLGPQTSLHHRLETIARQTEARTAFHSYFGIPAAARRLRAGAETRACEPLPHREPSISSQLAILE